MACCHHRARLKKAIIMVVEEVEASKQQVMTMILAEEGNDQHGRNYHLKQSVVPAARTQQLSFKTASWS